MLGLDQIGGVWQEIGEWLIILFMFVTTIFFYYFFTSIFVGVIQGRSDAPTVVRCNHKLNRNFGTGKYKCTKCFEEFD